MEALERLRTAVQGVLNEKVGEIQAQFEGERNSRMLIDDQTLHSGG